MKKKLIGIFVCIALISSLLPLTVVQSAQTSLRSITSEKTIEVLSNDLLCVVEPFNPQLLKRDGPGPGFYDTSEYLLGSTTVGVIFLESNGSKDYNIENWTPAEETNVLNEITQALIWWASQNPYAGVSFTLDIHKSVPTSYEPIIHPSAFTDTKWEPLYVSEAMAFLGYSTGDWMNQTRNYINAIRTSYGTDWAFAVFVVDSSNDLDGLFSDYYCASAYLGGPYIITTYDNGKTSNPYPFYSWGIGRMDQVMAHEIGHIYWATDEYNNKAEYSGYLNALETNRSGCLMDTNALTLSSGTKLQIGWCDTDGDTIQDILDTDPDTLLTPYTPNPTSNTILTYTGTATEVPYPNQNPQPSNAGNNVTLNHITSIVYRIDGGTFIPATLVDGVYDEPLEEFTFTLPSLTPRTPHLIEAISGNNIGNVDQSPSKDSVIIDNPPSNPTITGPSTGDAGEEYTYNISTTDPDTDQVYYWVDWGDSTNSNWLGPVTSGTTVIAKHTWSIKGSYEVKVKAKDSFTMESGWTTLGITIPFSYHKPLSMFEGLFQRFQFGFPLLRHLIGQ
jgi:hypothetical protein